MRPPVTEARLNQARRNQQFSNAPMGSGQCGLMAQEVAVFPVRYALDESPQTRDRPQGPNPLPKGWSAQLPELQSRSYTLRQLRDGWLYVWNSVDQTFHEYQVEGEYFTRHKWTDAQLYQDVRHNPGETHPYLLYPRRSQLRIAYSPVQWTWHLCELMRISASEQHQWMRAVDLPGYCTTGTASHGAPITELGNSVADILVYGAQAPTFSSTLLPTQASEADTPFKPAFEEALVRGRVPEQDTALFIALDDPLAMVDDLSMNLAGRLMEYSQFDMQHQQDLQSALAVQNLCGFDADAYMPASLKDPFQRQAYTDDLYTLLGAHDEVERAHELAPGDQAGMANWAAASTIAAAENAFKAKWGHLPERGKWQKTLEDWNAKRYWREDVRFDDAQKYLSQTTAEAQRLQEHCQRSEHDLLIWLDQLSPSAEAVYHDTCDEDQASQLLETAHALYTLLGNGENGQQWLCRQAEKPSTLFGLALFNFNPELAALIRQVTLNFIATGNLDDQGREGDGGSPALKPGSAGDATNLATRTNEIKAVFDLETVQNSKLYRNMSITAKHAMDTLIKVANNQAREAWHGLSGLLLPAMKQELALILAAPQVLFSTEISTATQLYFDPHYPRYYRKWLLEVMTVQKKITADKGVLQRPGTAYDQRAARRSLHAQVAQLKHLFLRRPNQIIGTASGYTRLRISILQIGNWLADLGQTEAMLQLKVAGTDDYFRRTGAWMEQNLGNALPALLVGLNAWNVHATARQAQNDGNFTQTEWISMGASAAYAANAVAALWVGPAWN
ncbi:toxin VasX, partial [Pseudomonas sp. Pseusp88]